MKLCTGTAIMSSKDINMSTNIDEQSNVFVDKSEHKCVECNKNFKNSHELKFHSQTFHHILPFTCQVCTKEFAFKSHLVEHWRAHIGYKPYKCDVCSDTFTLQSTLLVHKKNHDDKRAHVCAICARSFLSKSSFSRHMNSRHIKISIFKCPLCKSSFTRRIRFTEHLSVEHSHNQSFMCNICPKTYKHKNSLYKHRQHHHNTSTLNLQSSYNTAQLRQHYLSKAVEYRQSNFNAQNIAHDLCSNQFGSHTSVKQDEVGHDKHAEHIDNKLLFCSECNLKFSSHTVRSEHQRIAHDTNDVFQNKKCRIHYNNITALRSLQKQAHSNYCIENNKNSTTTDDLTQQIDSESSAYSLANKSCSITGKRKRNLMELDKSKIKNSNEFASAFFNESISVASTPPSTLSRRNRRFFISHSLRKPSWRRRCSVFDQAPRYAHDIRCNARQRQYIMSPH